MDILHNLTSYKFCALEGFLTLGSVRIFMSRRAVKTDRIPKSELASIGHSASQEGYEEYQSAEIAKMKISERGYICDIKNLAVNGEKHWCATIDAEDVKSESDVGIFAVVPDLSSNDSANHVSVIRMKDYSGTTGGY